VELPAGRAYIRMVSFIRTPLGRLLAVALAGFLLLAALAVYRVHLRTSAPNRAEQPIDFESMELEVQPVEFPATDGISIQGWLIRGEAAMPAILLCHDFGADKQSLINLAIALGERGFTLLLFDFRGHGASARSRSTLGLLEKRDILGAIDLLSNLAWLENRQVGLYGVGMGAHAGVLAAADQPAIRVLVLDSLYPDVSYALTRSFYDGWEFGVRRLPFIPRAIFRVLSGESIDGRSAAATIGKLPGRNLLLLAPEGDADLTAEMKRMYLSIPDQADADGNLLVVPASRTDALYGEQLDSYHRRVAQFFLGRLAAR
jgi:pimeloyl-ACP methyl ester carboxylesterase